MNSMSTIITLAICAVLVGAITWALIKGVWAASKKITIPIQITLFVVILVCIGRMLFTKENAKKLYEGIERTGVSQNMENTVRSALNLKQTEKSAPVAGTPTSASVSAPATTQGAPVAVAPAPAPNTASSASAVEVPIPTTPASAPAVAAPAPAPVPEPAPQVKPDYSRFDKGKKTFSYALPFGAQLKVGFRDGTYRIIVESLGALGTFEKKEIGKMVMNALSEYSGEKVMELDKSQVEIDIQYDDSASRTRVFVTVPPSAIK